MFHQFKKDIFREKQKTVFDNIIEKYRSRMGGRVKHLLLLLLPIRLSILFV